MRSISKGTARGSSVSVRRMTGIVSEIFYCSFAKLAITLLQVSMATQLAEMTDYNNSKAISKCAQSNS